jgi:hypothetical protein
MNLSERVKGILLKPKQEWQTISKEATAIPELYKTYIVILAAIGPVASIIGMSLVGVRVPFVGWFRVSIFTSISSAIVHYILTLVGVYVLGLIINALAPHVFRPEGSKPGFQGSYLFLHAGLDRRGCWNYPFIKPVHDPWVVRVVPSLPGTSGSDGISAGKILRIHHCGDHRSHCHFHGDRIHLACLHFLSHAEHVRPSDSIKGEHTKAIRTRP